MNLLWVLPKWPLPAIDGAMQAHMALLKEWPRDRGTLDLAVFCPPDPKTWPSAERITSLREATGAREVILLPSKESLRWRRLLMSFFERRPLPLTVRRFAGQEAREALAAAATRLMCSQANRESVGTDRVPDASPGRCAAPLPWTHVMIDGTHAAALWLHGNSFCLPEGAVVSLRAHNEETEFWSQLAEHSRGLKRWLLRRECALMNRFQAEIVAASNLVCPVSLADAEKFLALYPFAKERTKEMPIGFDWPEALPPPPTSRSPRFLFLGRLDWHPNAEGLNWLLKNVWPEVHRRRPELKLDVVGGFASPDLQAQLHATPGVKFHGLVPDVAPFYQASSLSLIPIFTGSGTRVKAIESFRHARSVLTTSLGIEGVPLEAGRDFALADTPAEWIKVLTSVSALDFETLGRNAFLNGRLHFDRKLIQEALVQSLTDVKGDRLKEG